MRPIRQSTYKGTQWQWEADQQNTFVRSGISTNWASIQSTPSQPPVGRNESRSERKEDFAVMFALEHFHTYTYGMRTVVHTNDQPPENKLET